jgi:hypothetical protein
MAAPHVMSLGRAELKTCVGTGTITVSASHNYSTRHQQMPPSPAGFQSVHIPCCACRRLAYALTVSTCGPLTWLWQLEVVNYNQPTKMAIKPAEFVEADSVQLKVVALEA